MTVLLVQIVGLGPEQSFWTPGYSWARSQPLGPKLLWSWAGAVLLDPSYSRAGAEILGKSWALGLTASQPGAWPRAGAVLLNPSYSWAGKLLLALVLSQYTLISLAFKPMLGLESDWESAG